MLRLVLRAIAVISLFTFVQGVAVDADAPVVDFILSKRADFGYEGLKAGIKTLKPAQAWVVGFFPEKDCKGLLLGKADADTVNPQPCEAVKDMMGVDQSKVQSGAVYLQKPSNSGTSTWAAKLVVKGDGLSPCGVFNEAGFGKEIGFDLPEDGWTCQNGQFSAYYVHAPGK